MTSPSKWGRWQWPEKIGRWHAFVAVEGSTYNLACGRIRTAPKITGARPDGAAACPSCAKLDDLRMGYRREPTKQPAPEPVLVALRGGAAPGGAWRSEGLHITPGLCLCGAPGCNKGEAKVLREQKLAREAAAKAAAKAGFEAWLATREEEVPE